jgi:hypothetical protein
MQDLGASVSPKVGGIKVNPTQSDRIKPSQTKKWVWVTGDAASGKWQVASGKWGDGGRLMDYWINGWVGAGEARMED